MYVWSNSPKYRCQACNNKIPVDDLETVYREQLRQFLLSPEEIDAHAAAAQEAMIDKERLIEATQAEVRKIETEDERLYQLYLANSLSKEDFGRRHKPLSARRSQLEEELPRLQAEVDVLRIGMLSRGEVPTTIGERLLAERRRRGLAICEAAALMGVDETTFWWWESSRRVPRHQRTKELVEAFLEGP